MKPWITLLFILAGSLSLKSQNTDIDRIARVLTDDQIVAPLKYLASDQLKGRSIALPEIDTAADYIASQFRHAGVKPVPGASGYYQIFNLRFTPYQKDHMDKQVAANIGISVLHGLTIKNVLAYVLGTDIHLRNQFIILSAHYDHVGLADSAVVENGKMDSIFNGARDNATGTAAVIAAAIYFARHPPKRSILFICYSAEEEGELGSKYYADHPLFPLSHTVYNLNVDNAGYNTINSICLFGLGRTSADSLIQKACVAYRFSVLPEPGLDLFERSDNYSLALKGVPATNFSLGMKSWDSEVEAHYHRLSDEVGNMDLTYVVKFIQAYILSSEYIANDDIQPKWTAGDPFEKDWMKLFGNSVEHVSK